MRLWTFALDQAACLNNHLLNKFSSVAPLETFTKSKLDSAMLRNEKVWGCSTHVLDPNLKMVKNYQSENQRLAKDNTWVNQARMLVQLG